MHTQTGNKPEEKATTLEKKNVTDNLRKHTHFADFVVRKLKKKQEKQTTRQEKHLLKRRENPEKSIRFPEANFSSLFKFITEFFSPAHPPQTLRDESRTNGGKLWINIFYIYMWKMRALSSLGNVCSICHTSVVRAAILWCKGTAASNLMGVEERLVNHICTFCLGCEREVLFDASSLIWSREQV